MDTRKHSSTMSERAFQSAVLELARWAKWLVYHTHNSRRSEPGFPDLCLVRGDTCLMIELKANDGRLSKAQKAWIAALDVVPGIEAAVWRPRHWTAIEETLTAACG